MTISAKAKWTESSSSRITPGRLVIERVSEGGLRHPRIHRQRGKNVALPLDIVQIVQVCLWSNDSLAS